MEYFVEMIKRTFDFKGKSNLRQYWLAQLSNFVIMIVFCLPSLLYLSSDYQMFLIALNALSGLYNVIIFLPNLSLTCRRLRDAGYSPLAFLLALIPVIGEILLLIILFSPTKIKFEHVVTIQNSTNEDVSQDFSKKSEQKTENISPIYYEIKKDDDIYQQNNEQKIESKIDVDLKIEKEKFANSDIEKEQKNEQQEDLKNENNEFESVVFDKKMTRSQKIKILQKLRDEQKISIEQYQQEILKILSK